jgi:hypothetical protein
MGESNRGLHVYEMASLCADTQDDIRDCFERRAAGKFFYNHCQTIKAGQLDTWDFQVIYSFRVNSLLSIHPSRNLVKQYRLRGGCDAYHRLDQSAGKSAGVRAGLPAAPSGYRGVLAEGRSAHRGCNLRRRPGH